RHAVDARRGVDAHDPEPPEVTLAGAAVPVGEVERALHLLLGDAVELRFREVVPLGPAKDLLPLETSLVPAFDSRHRRSPCRRTLRGPDRRACACSRTDLTSRTAASYVPGRGPRRTPGPACRGRASASWSSSR